LDFAELDPEGSSEFAVAGFVFALLAGFGAEQVGLLRTFVFQFNKVLLDSCIFGGFTPGLEPVDGSVRSRSGTDHVEHPFGGIGGWRTWRATVADEVVDQYLRVLADFSKVDCATTSLKEEETIKALEQHGRWLMDGTHWEQVNDSYKCTIRHLQIAWPFFFSLSRRSRIAQDVWESSPEVGSSRKRLSTQRTFSQ
jgi:hypothetical protein